MALLSYFDCVFPPLAETHTSFAISRHPISLSLLYKTPFLKVCVFSIPRPSNRHCHIIRSRQNRGESSCLPLNDNDPNSRIFIKAIVVMEHNLKILRIDYPKPSEVIEGLSRSTSEGYLAKTFSRFGLVSRVKIITERLSKQSLGFAYVWFTSEEDAQVAVKEMDGEFVDGRFISVTIAKPKAPSSQVRAVPYKF